MANSTGSWAETLDWLSPEQIEDLHGYLLMAGESRQGIVPDSDKGD
jgi:hypothetical protein